MLNTNRNEHDYFQHDGFLLSLTEDHCLFPGRVISHGFQDLRTFRLVTSYGHSLNQKSATTNFGPRQNYGMR